MNMHFPLILPYFGWNTHKSPHDQSYTFFNVFFYTITENAIINSLICAINSNDPFWLHIKFFVAYPFSPNSHNIRFQATNITNIYNSPNLNQIDIFESTLRMIQESLG